MRKVPAGLLIAGIALGGCAPRVRVEPVRYETVYDCSETLTTPTGVYVAGEDGVGWERDLGDGMTIGTSLHFLGDAERRGFASTGFAGNVVDHPLTFITFGTRFEPLNHSPGKWGSVLAAQVRIGDRTIDRWVPSNMIIAVWWSEAKRLLAASGDMVITLHDGHGKLLQQAVLPHDSWLEAERTLMPMHARVTAKAADREHRCAASRQEIPEESVYG